LFKEGAAQSFPSEGKICLKNRSIFLLDFLVYQQRTHSVHLIMSYQSSAIHELRLLPSHAALPCSTTSWDTPFTRHGL